MKEELNELSIEQVPIGNTSILEYDCICIGTSMIISLEACYQVSKGCRVLMVDKEKTFGGAWKTITIDGIKNVENAIHYFLPDERAIEFMDQTLGFPVEVSKGKYRYFNIFNLGYIKFSYNSWISRLIHKLFYSGSIDGFIPLVRHIFRSIILVYSGRGSRSYYVSSGSAKMLEKIKDRLDKHQVEIWYQSEINNVYFDLGEKKVKCQIGDKIVVARSIILGHGARLPEIDSSNGELKLQEKIHPRPAFHLVVEDKKRPRSLEVVMTSDSLIKYVHDVTRFSSLRDSNRFNKKIFVFALHPNILDDDGLCDKLFNKLIDIKLINADAQVITSLYSDIILPTNDDEDLNILKDSFGDLVNILRTENFARGIGYYAERWNS